MIALLQRVSSASVTIDAQVTAEIGAGLLLFVGVQKGDSPRQAEELARRVCTYRVFPDAVGRMNLDVCESAGSVLAVPQFTLSADTSRGRRPGFSAAASPELASEFFELFCESVRLRVNHTQTGTFGADMKVALINDGPVTFWLSARATPQSP